jgi:ribosome biogenesis GTPase
VPSGPQPSTNITLVPLPVSLADLGWSEARERAFAHLAASGLVPGRVVLEHNHVFRVITAAAEILAETAGALKHKAGARHELPVVGDWVAVRPDAAGARSQIREVLPRHSRFSRKAAGRDTVEQVVAANIDTVFIVFGLDVPVNARAIERYLVVARHSGAHPVVVLNKGDLIARPDDAVTEARTVAGDTPVLVVSTKSGAGTDVLDAYLVRGRTVALIGPSGAGKSSIVNRLVGRDVLATGDVREWDQRGRHTSVHRQLVVRDRGGLVIDTPGMRELQLWETDAVAETFGDVAELAPSCRFRDCRHDSEPGCAVKGAVDAGAIDPGRYASYLKLQREQEEVGRKREERQLTESKRHAKVQNKALRALYKVRDRQK